MAEVPLHVTEAMPDSASLADPNTVVEFPLKLAPDTGEVMETVGGVFSRLMAALTLAVFPALSTAIPVTAWLLPWVVTCTGAEQLAIPERESLQAKFTVTLLLFQPAELGAGETVATIAGGVLSMLTVTVIVAVLPTLFVAVP